jgi:hypothetical protein
MAALSCRAVLQGCSPPAPLAHLSMLLITKEYEATLRSGTANALGRRKAVMPIPRAFHRHTVRGEVSIDLPLARLCQQHNRSRSAAIQEPAHASASCGPRLGRSQRGVPLDVVGGGHTGEGVRAVGHPPGLAQHQVGDGTDRARARHHYPWQSDTDGSGCRCDRDAWRHVG